MSESHHRLIEADNPGTLETIRICWPPPLILTLTTSIHTLIFCIPLAIIHPIIGLAYVVLSYLYAFCVHWPANRKRRVKITEELNNKWGSKTRVAGGR